MCDPVHSATLFSLLFGHRHGGPLSAVASCFSYSEPASALIESSKSPHTAPRFGLKRIIVMTSGSGCCPLLSESFNNLKPTQVEGASPGKHPHRAPLVPV